eukprot:403343333
MQHNQVKTKKIKKRHDPKNGSMWITLNHPYYQEGGCVTGFVNFRVNAPLNAAKLEITVNGKQMQKQYDISGYIIRDQSKGYLKQHILLQVFTQVLQPGDYSLPISIPLPQELPGSLSYVDPVYYQYSHLSYLMKASLEDYFGTKLIKAKRVLIVTERPEYSISESKQEKEFKANDLGFQRTQYSNSCELKRSRGKSC